MRHVDTHATIARALDDLGSGLHRARPVRQRTRLDASMKLGEE